MSSLLTLFRTLQHDGLKPKHVPSYAGSSLLMIDNKVLYAFDPTGQQMDIDDHRNRKQQNILAWTFSFISIETHNRLRNSNKIVVVGPSTDYYKIYFFTDDYQHFRVELKNETGPNLKNLMQSSFKKGRGKEYYDELIALSMSHAVNPLVAGQMLVNCPYEPASVPQPLMFQWVKHQLDCHLVGQADQRIATSYPQELTA